MSLVSSQTVKENDENETKKLYVDLYDEQKDCYLRLHGLFVCIESERLERIHLILIRADQAEYLVKIREMLRMDEITKILFFAQKHARIMYKAMNASMKVT